jgi:hypothetical protein
MLIEVRMFKIITSAPIFAKPLLGVCAFSGLV